MADSGGSHGIARTNRTRNEEERVADLERIKKYRELEDQIRARVKQNDYSPEVYHLTTKLLRLNPEYYTIWNVRRRSLISGLLSKRSASSSPSKASPSSSPTATTKTCSAASSSSLSTATPSGPESQTVGKSGTTAEDEDATAAQQPQPDTPEEGHKKDLEMIKSELTFTIPLLIASPKCYWIWSYRRWILDKAVELLPTPAARRIWEEELGLAGKMLIKDRRNFHAWNYRRAVVAQLESAELDGRSMVQSEFDYTTAMIKQDLSNFSAWHTRSKLIPRLLNEKRADDTARKDFLETELNMIREAINVGPEDQSLWYYHQSLMLDLVNPVGRETICPSFTPEDRVGYLEREIEEIKELLEDYDDIKLIYEALLDYTIYLCQLEEREPEPEEKEDMTEWLGKLRKLDPMRDGRWTDLEKDLGLLEVPAMADE